MSRYVKISTVGGWPCQVQPGTEDGTIINIVLEWLEKNLDQVLPDNPDLVVLTENVAGPMGYSPGNHPGYYEKFEQPFTAMLFAKAKKYKTNIIYPAYLREGGKIYNTQRLINRSGEASGCYKKSFPTIGEVEMGITPGGEQGLMKSDIGNIAGAICFDLNFYPVLFHTASLHPDLVVFSSMYHGGFMQQVWAYFCRAHFVGSVDSAPCEIYNPAGVKIASTTNYLNTATGTVNLDGALFHVDYNIFDGKFNEAKKYYGPAIKISDPGYLGSVYITSESEDLTINDIIERFKFEKLDDYFRRSIDMIAKARGKDYLVKLHDQY